MVSESARGLEGGCLRGFPCDIVHDNGGVRYTVKVSCCYGLAMDLLESVSQELEFDFYLYMVPDSTFGTKKVNPEDKSEVKWTGVVAELMNGHAQMAFTALSITRPRVKRTQSFQSKVLRIIVNAPYYVTNNTLHHDLNIHYVLDVIPFRFSNFHLNLIHHPNPLASSSHPYNPPRRLKRQWPRDLL
ncbi:unnamed protein product [Nezara viridula]|uniref:Ionotropic glutamate receptor L-glutamate and glycine-binding domain-containing protein n=1 Tax=Nezara viridula TaxID=85310 RepID=A0A9P0H5C7_NEZVI|nr:unnamed protein product [Nezara viridula]